MQTTIAFTDLRTHLAETLRALDQAAEPVFISRRGEPAAVLMSLAQYRRLTAQADGPLARRMVQIDGRLNVRLTERSASWRRGRWRRWPKLRAACRASG